MTKQILSALIIIVALNGTSRAQKKPTRHIRQKAAVTVPALPPQSLPTGRAIIDKFIKAEGSTAQAAKIKTRRTVGTVEISGLSLAGTVEVLQKAPDKMLSRMELPGLGMILEGFDGTVAWAQDPFTGLREKKGAELLAQKLRARLGPATSAGIYVNLKVLGITPVEGRASYIVAQKLADGSTTTTYYDCATGLVTRVDSETETPQGKLPVQSYLSDYRLLDGIQIPFASRVVTPLATVLLKIVTVVHNAEIDEKVFAKPIPEDTGKIPQ